MLIPYTWSFSVAPGQRCSTLLPGMGRVGSAWGGAAALAARWEMADAAEIVSGVEMTKLRCKGQCGQRVFKYPCNF